MGINVNVGSRARTPNHVVKAVAEAINARVHGIREASEKLSHP